VGIPDERLGEVPWAFVARHTNELSEPDLIAWCRERLTPYRVPVLSEQEGVLSVVWLRAYIEMAAKELGIPLTGDELAALDLFEEVSQRDDVKLSFMLEPGQVIFFNNCVMLHNRTSFEDDPDPARKRHLLRLWLMLDGGRPLVPEVHAYKGTTGIVGHEGTTTYYRGNAIPDDDRPEKAV